MLDIGSSKICCLIARLKPREESRVLPGRTHTIEVIGIGHQRSRGIKSGVVVDLEAAEQAIRAAVDAAERMAGVTVESLIVSISAGRLMTEAFSADISLGGHQVADSDIAKVLRAGRRARAWRRSVRSSIRFPIGFSLDGESGISDPRGMVGDKLGVDMHVVTAENAPLRNLELCINRAHLSVEAVVATPYAAGLSALVDDEAQMGCACIDMGGGTTTISVFAEGKLRVRRRGRDRRQPRDDGHRARAFDAPRRCRAAEDPARLGAGRRQWRGRRDFGPADRRGRARPAEPDPARS